MSIEIILIPMAIAAISAWQAKNAVDDEGRHIVAVGTRMRNETLLQHSLTDTGATVTRSNDVLTATWAQAQGRFTKDATGVWAVHFVGDIDNASATELVTQVDAAYGRRVQAEVLTRLRERAETVGMEIESETEEDDHSVTMVLNLTQGGNT